MEISAFKDTAENTRLIILKGADYKRVVLMQMYNVWVQRICLIGDSGG